MINLGLLIHFKRPLGQDCFLFDLFASPASLTFVFWPIVQQTQGGLQYLLAGARANVGVKSGSSVALNE